MRDEADGSLSQNFANRNLTCGIRRYRTNQSTLTIYRQVARISQTDYTIVIAYFDPAMTVFRPLLQKQSVLFIGITLLLHYFFLESAVWKTWSPQLRDDTPQTMQVRLQTAVAAADPAPTPAAKAKKLSPPPVSPTSNAVEPEPELKKDADTTPLAIEPKTEDKVEAVVTSFEQDQADKAAAAAQLALAPPEFAIRIPEDVDMKLEVSHTKLNETPTYGHGNMHWESRNGKYKISIEAGIQLLFAKLTLYQSISEGRVDVYGITPLMYTESRRGRAATAIHFNHREHSAIFSAANRSFPIENGVQDAASIFFHLASIGYANAEQFRAGNELNIQLAEGRETSMTRFISLGEEKIDSALNLNKGEAGDGQVNTVHIQRPPREGSYHSTIDIWLAPDLGWYPVQIRNTESNGTVTLQRVTSLQQKINLDR